MSRTRLVTVLSILAVVAAGRADAQFPEEGDKDFEAKLKAAVAAIKPLPETPIPDDPPPHEGALFDLPFVVEPPDLLLIEVIEALPGRPITGERLVRPDGTITLGFYGTIHVRGLTLEQIKVKMIQHLRNSLPDAVLGLEEVWSDGENPGELPPAKPNQEGQPDQPGAGKGVGGKKDDREKPAPEEARKRPTGLLSPRRDSAASRRVRFASDQPGPKPQAPPLNLTLPPVGGARITIEIIPPGLGAGNLPAQPPPDFNPVLVPEMPHHPAYVGKPVPGEGGPKAAAPPESEGFWKRRVAAADSNRVFVDVSAYNSKFYYVQGDVVSPGKMPWTGSETVLDAMNYAGGFIQTANPNDIRLIRPARGGKPIKVYRIDFEAITQRGEKDKNLQVFPGDRIVVGRNALVQTTIYLDRLASTFQTLVNSSLQTTFALRSFVAATPEMSPAQRAALLEEWYKVWWKAANQSGGPTPDEKTFQELLLRLMKPATPPEKK